MEGSNNYSHIPDKRFKRYNRAPLTESYDCCIDERYPVSDLTLPQLYERGAKRYLNTGVSWWRPREFIAYPELYNQGMKLAKGLLALGLRRGDAIMSFGCPGGDSATLFVAASSLGIIFSAPYVASPVETNIVPYIKAVEPKLILIGNNPQGCDFEDSYPAVLYTIDELIRLSPPDEYKPPHILRDEYSKPTHVTGLTDRRLMNIEQLCSLIELGENISDAVLSQHKALVTVNEPVIYVFSSGSTGKPKTILTSADVMTNGGVRREQRWDITSESRFACTSMTEEEGGFIEELCAGFYTGFNFVALPDLSVTSDPEILCREYLEALSYHSSIIALRYCRTEYVYANPYYISYIVTHEHVAVGYDISSLRSILLGSGTPTTPAWKRQALRRFPDTLDVFGMSEFWYATHPHMGFNNVKINTIGHVVVNCEAKIVDKNGDIMPCNTEGELMFRGPGAFIEYKDQPELTKSTKSDDGWVRTGDCAVMDEDGDIFLNGRMTSTERFKVVDEVVYAPPIERVMSEYENISEIIVVGIVEDIGHELCYCVILNADYKNCTTVKDVYNYAKENVPNEFWVPSRVFFYDSLPRRGSRNKICRKTLTKDVEEKVAENPNDSLTPYRYE